MPISHARTATGIAFWIHVPLGAMRVGLSGVHGDALRIAVLAPPIEGRANAACLEVLAAAFAVKRTAVSLHSAAKGRRKRLAIAGDPAALAAQLSALACES